MNETTELIMKQLNQKKTHAITHEVGGGDEIDATKLKNISNYLETDGDFTGTWNGLEMTAVDPGLSTSFNALKTDVLQRAINVKYPPSPLVAAVGNGIVDDSSAIQSVIDLLSSAGGGTVYIPAGTYIIGTALQRKSKVIIKGSGAETTILQTLNNTMDAIVGVSGLVWSELTGLSISSPTLGTVNSAMKFDPNNGGTQNKDYNIKIINFANGFNAGDNWYSNSIDNVRIWYAINSFRLIYTAIGVAIQNQISNAYIHQPRGIGVNVSGFKRLAFFNLNIDTTSFPNGIYINTNSQVIINNFNCEGSVLASSGFVIMVRGGSEVTLMNGQVTVASAVATAHLLRIESTGTNVTAINVDLSTVVNSRQVYVANFANSIFTNLSPNITDVNNATGPNAVAVVNNLNGPKSANSQTIDLSGGQQDFIILSPTANARVKSVKLVYNEATSIDAGVVVTVKTNNRTISTITSEVSKALYSTTTGTLTNAAIDAGSSLIASCPGGKVGTGNCQVLVEYWNE